MLLDNETAKAVGEAVGAIIVAVVSSHFWAKKRARANPISSEVSSEELALRVWYVKEIERLRTRVEFLERQGDKLRTENRKLEDDLWALRRKLPRDGV
jgi:hypothetical protein